MNVKYRLQGTKELKKVYIRFYHHKLDLPADTGLFAREYQWNAEAGQYNRNDKVNLELAQLKVNIIDAFNEDFSTGTIINKAWLQEIVKKSFLRPNAEVKLINPNHTIFLYEFGLYWLKNHADTWVTRDNTLFTNKAKTQHSKALEQFNRFQDDRQIKLKDFDLNEIKEFYKFLMQQNYASSTAKKTIAEVKFFCNRALDLKYNVNLDFQIKHSFVDKTPKAIPVYLNKSEIQVIYEHDFSNNDELDIIRDNFILSLWTGLRVSDLLNLTQENLRNGFIEAIIIKTQTLVTIPILPQVEAILNKRMGFLPPKVDEYKYNLGIKEICKICGINASIYGKIMDSSTNRKVAKWYKKHELVTSHTARRSFATNLNGIISNDSIAKILGWTSPQMVTFYNKKTNIEEAEHLKAVLK